MTGTPDDPHRPVEPPGGAQSPAGAGRRSEPVDGGTSAPPHPAGSGTPGPAAWPSLDEPSLDEPNLDEPSAEPAPPTQRASRRDTTAPGRGTQAVDGRPTGPPPPAQHRVERTRAGGLWVAVAAAALVLLFLLIFILQNSQQVRVSFFGADGDLPLGVAMLLSAVAGALLVVLVGTARIVQLRLTARRHRSRDAATRRRP